MSSEQEILDEINDLAAQYSSWIISYDDYREKRYQLLNKLEDNNITLTNDKSIIKDMVESFSGLIKR